MTEAPSQKTKSRAGFGILMFALGSAFGIFITLLCFTILAIFGILPIHSRTQQYDTNNEPPDAHVELSLGDDGCHVVRGEVEGSTPVSSLTWVIKDMEGYTLLERNAEGEYDTKYFRGGQYKVYLKAWYNGQYYPISNEVIVDCPQGP
jgi:hypothetical protein